MVALVVKQKFFNFLFIWIQMQRFISTFSVFSMELDGIVAAHFAMGITFSTSNYLTARYEYVWYEAGPSIFCGAFMGFLIQLPFTRLCSFCRETKEIRKIRRKKITSRDKKGPDPEVRRERLHEIGEEMLGELDKLAEIMKGQGTNHIIKWAADTKKSPLSYILRRNPNRYPNLVDLSTGLLFFVFWKIYVCSIVLSQMWEWKGKGEGKKVTLLPSWK
eukprot:TRINITY_DN10855_c0_g3_i1.p2 TRINITY_DN10855_c0_g3~~TRINITY_DN10855_c0_g3_i1.p2  ORF type:complete len:218 (-),score=37.26 TRINITY_DN10855_c0_g3_i1:484-1137(-)